MSSSEESEALRIIRNSKLRTASVFIASLALVAWAVSSVIQSNQNRILIEKNADLVHIVAGLEAQNEEFIDRLQCREQIADRRDDAIGRGLAAVAVEDSAELARQAEILIEIANEEQCE